MADAARQEIPEWIKTAQYRVSDPDYSAWVSANAGSGKTYVLSQRVIRLMLAGTAPDRILCLTFTKAAAAEMKARVFDRLSQWPLMDDAELDDALVELTGRRADDTDRRRARELFTRALDTPGGLKIQTIHAFCEALLHQFPLEANIPGNFRVVQDQEQAALLQEARNVVLAGDIAGMQGCVDAYQALVEQVSDSAIEKGLDEIIRIRSKFEASLAAGMDAAIADLYPLLGVNPEETIDGLYESALANLPFDREQRQALIHICREVGQKTNVELADTLEKFENEMTAAGQYEALCPALLTKDRKKILDRHVTGAVEDALPGTVERMQALAECWFETLDKVRSLELIAQTRHLFVLGEAVLEHYARIKNGRGLVDFDQLIERTAALLGRSEISDWVRYRLDRGIDHLAVDEAQDTSPDQWQVINALTQDFFAGAGASKAKRTVFVVGDDKQSIYSFQGADPNEFKSQRRRFEQQVTDARQEARTGELNMSFRSTPDVLGAVDKVFEQPDARRGVATDGAAPVHTAIRQDAPGDVQVWDTLVKTGEEASNEWDDPVDTHGNDDPQNRLAQKIADTLGEWIGQPNPATGKPLTCRDCLVLVRNRTGHFIPAFTRAAKEAGLAIAGADRLNLAEHMATEDLLALGRVVLLPEDDLALAGILKSPAMGFSEEELFVIANDRKNLPLMERLRNPPPGADAMLAEKAGDAYRGLLDLVRLAERESVFGFYCRVLGERGWRRSFLARLGYEAEEVLDAFLDEAITHDMEHEGGLQSFIAKLASSDIEIKREVETERDEIRIMTAHSAKGLEASVVFLVDPGSAVWTQRFRPPLVDMAAENMDPRFVWIAESKKAIDASTRVTERIKADAEEEYRRLLYVGMTRAADRLVICGYEPKTQSRDVRWHQMVSEALQAEGIPLVDAEGDSYGFRWQSADPPPPKPALPEAKPAAVAVDQGSGQSENWLFEPARVERALPRPLSPSRAYAMIGDAKTSGFGSITPQEPGDRMLQLATGQAIHRLLEHLAGTGPAEAETKISTYLQRVGAAWPQEMKDRVSRDVVGVLSSGILRLDDRFEVRNEVSVSGSIEAPRGAVPVTGQIDRLLISDDQIVIMDFKTSRIVPDSPSGIPNEAIVQMALYREIVKQIWPGKVVSCCIVWTSAPLAMEVPGESMDASLAAIKIG